MEPVDSGAADWMELTRRVAALDEENKRLRALAYMGEHEFPDLTWKSRAEELIADNRRLRENIRRLLDQVGDSRPCKGPTCKATIWYVRLKTGRVAPYTDAALNHFADCPDAGRFKKGT